MDTQKLWDSLKIYYDTFFNALIGKVKEINKGLFDHVNNKDNPHGVDKTTVGLGNVPNYPSATEQEAREGKVNNALMTPEMTSLLVSEKALTTDGLEEIVDALTDAFTQAKTEIDQI